MSRQQPGEALAFEAVVDDYDAARPTYPPDLYAALPPLAGLQAVELGAGTGIATRELVARGAAVTATDLGPKMLGRNVSRSPGLRAAVARAEALPLRDASVDAVLGAQMWHWVEPERAAPEVARVLRPGGFLALWWNEVEGPGLPWWEAQQDRLEAGNPTYHRDYRLRDYGAELAPWFSVREMTLLHWERTLGWPAYERWLRSKSYVQRLGDGLEDFVAAERASLAAAFPDGVIREPFAVRLWVCRV